MFLDFPHEKNFIAAATNMANIWQIRIQKADGEKSKWPTLMYTHKYALLNIFNFQLLKCVLTSVYLKVPWTKRSKTWGGGILSLHRWSFFILLIIDSGWTINQLAVVLVAYHHHHDNYLWYHPHYMDQHHHHHHRYLLLSISMRIIATILTFTNILNILSSKIFRTLYL